MNSILIVDKYLEKICGRPQGTIMTHLALVGAFEKYIQTYDLIVEVDCKRMIQPDEYLSSLLRVSHPFSPIVLPALVNRLFEVYTGSHDILCEENKALRAKVAMLEAKLAHIRSSLME